MHSDTTITLRAPEPQDLDFLYRLENSSDIKDVSWGEAPVSRQMLWDYLNNYSADIFRDRQLRLIVECDGHSCGTIDISDFDPANSRAMIGIALEHDFRGKGIAHAALAMTLDFCKQQIGMHQAAAIVPKNNAPSIRLFTGLGFKSAGCLRSWIKRGNSYTDAVIFQKML